METFAIRKSMRNRDDHESLKEIVIKKCMRLCYANCRNQQQISEK